jgi:ComF family protein
VVVLADPPLCERCGRPSVEPLAFCTEDPPPGIESLRAPLLFDGPVRDALLKLKFAGLREVATALGRGMAQAWDGPPAVLTWVPLSRQRLAERGYDQAEALARAAGEALGAEVLPLLARTRETPPQARRNRAERRDSLRGAFEAAGGVPQDVVLVDDVVTTGSTAGECAEVLRAAGARRVHVLSAARTLSGPLPARVYARSTVPSGSVVARG